MRSLITSGMSSGRNCSNAPENGHILLKMHFLSDGKCMLLSLVRSGEAPMDNIDGDRLLNVSELWSHMIIFSSLTPSKVQSSSVKLTYGWCKCRQLCFVGL